MSAEANLIRLGLELPPVPPPSGSFVPFRRAGAFLYLSGQGPRDASGTRLTGRVPDVVSPDEARDRARRVGLHLLAVARAALGTLDRVEAVVKLFGMVNAAPGFTAHPSVIDGCSDLFHEVFGEAGRHARSAVGMASLPHDISVEIEAILLVRD
jgi:enamine deaminase RidA (YjgF/YER057c/UK114 family)